MDWSGKWTNFPPQSLPIRMDWRGLLCFQTKAGFGVFIPNSQVHPSHAIYISARVRTSSVLEAEAEALSCGKVGTHTLQLSEINFLSDIQTMVSFLRQNRTVPHWRLFPSIEEFKHHTSETTYKVFKIHWSQNSSARILPHQAGNAWHSSTTFSCSNSLHITGCPLLQALSDVSWVPLHLIHVRCS